MPTPPNTREERRGLRAATRDGVWLGLLAGLWVLATEFAHASALLDEPIRFTGRLLLLYALCFAALGVLAGCASLILPRPGRASRAAILGVALAVLMLGLRLRDLDDEGSLPILVSGITAFAVAVAGAAAWLVARARRPEESRASAALVLAGSAAALALAAKLLTDSSSIELAHPVAVALAFAALVPLLLAACAVPLVARIRPRGTLLALWLVPLLALALFAGGSARAPARGTVAAATPSADPPSLPPIVWITVDTVRADRMHLYGHSVPNTPNLDALARTATVYSRALSPGPSTAQAVPSLLSGLTPYRHGSVSQTRRLPEELVLLPEILRERGYQTVAQSANHWVSPRYGLMQGFEEFIHYGTDDSLFLYDLMKVATRIAPWPMFALREQLPPYAYAPITELVDGAIAILERRDPDRPLFLYLHPVDPHGPYQPPGRYLPADAPVPSRRDFLSYWQLLDAPDVSPAQREAALARYDGEIAYTDAELGRLFASLREHDLFDRALIVVTSDHGEHFQEHGLWGHGKSLYAQLLHVPLLVKYPSQREPRVVPARVGTIDLFPTILRLLGEDCAECDGRPLQEAELRDSRILLAYQMDDHEVKPVRRSIVEGRFKLVRTSRDGSEREELFDVEEDPGEGQDLGAQHPEVVARLAGRLRDYEQAVGSTPEGDPITLAPAEIERLEELGYLR